MAIIINFQEYVKVKNKNENHKKVKNVSPEAGQIIYFMKAISYLL